MCNCIFINVNIFILNKFSIIIFFKSDIIPIAKCAIDPYLFIKAAYAQRRLAQVGKMKYNLYYRFDDQIDPFKWLGE